MIIQPSAGSAVWEIEIQGAPLLITVSFSPVLEYNQYKGNHTVIIRYKAVNKQVAGWNVHRRTARYITVSSGTGCLILTITVKIIVYTVVLESVWRVTVETPHRTM